MISVDKVVLKYGERDLLKEVSFMVNPKDRIGLVGKNGSGKSTLLKMVTKEIKPDSGSVVVPGDITLGYLPQHMQVENNTTVVNETEKAFSELLDIQKEIDGLNQKICDTQDFESDEYSDWLNRLTILTERLHLLEEGKKEEKIEQCLTGLGFKRSDFNRPTTELSGGWRMRIEIAKILLKAPDVLLLDEPTNHLDIESIQWLESFLKEYNGAVVLISHDRAFLDNLTTRTLEISLGNLYDYPVPYTRFTELKKERREHQIAAYRNQQKMIEESEKFIERFRYKATKAVQVQSRIKQLDKLERIQIDEEDLVSMNIKFPPAPRSGTVVVETKGLSKSYGNVEVLKNIDLAIERGEKVAFVGKNGEGKTTLSRIIIGELDFVGGYKPGHNIKIGYYAQNQDQVLDENLTVFETLDYVAVGDIRTKLRDILGAFLFSGEDIDKKVKVLSGGERSRLALARLLLEPYNLLVMDEPTNHLDLLSKDVLKEALKKYDGTLIVVSHDRYFLDGLVTKVYEFNHKKIKEHLGGIYDFIKKKRIGSLNDLNISNNSRGENKVEKNNAPNKDQYLLKKELEKKTRKVRREIDNSENKINELETKIGEIDKIMMDPVKVKDPENQHLFKEYEKLQVALKKEMQKWESLYEELEKIKA